jgi:hypothetical protein
MVKIEEKTFIESRAKEGFENAADASISSSSASV